MISAKKRDGSGTCNGNFPANMVNMMEKTGRFLSNRRNRRSKNIVNLNEGGVGIYKADLLNELKVRGR